MKITLQVSKIGYGIYQGTQPTIASYQKLKDAGVNAVLSMNAENPYATDARRIFGERNFLHIPWHDDFQEKPVSDFARIDWWRDEMREDAIVYVHCAMGINRSTVATIWLLMREGLSGDDAYNLVVRQRPSALGWPVKGYRTSLLRAHSILRADHRGHDDEDVPGDNEEDGTA